MTNEAPVLIVGGGGASLTTSMLLSTLGIEHILVSSLPTTSVLPKAHVLNQRTIEILGDVGVAQQIYAKSTPAEKMAAMGWYAGFLGPDTDFGRLIGKVESWLRIHESQLDAGQSLPQRQSSANPSRTDHEGARLKKMLALKRSLGKPGRPWQR